MHTKCVWKSNSNVSNSNFGRGLHEYMIIMMGLSALRPPGPFIRETTHYDIKEVKEVPIHIRFDIVHCYQECA